MPVSELTNDFPVTLAAEEAIFNMSGFGRPNRSSSKSSSQANPGISNSLHPKDSVSGISDSAYKSSKLPGDPCA